MNIAPVYMRSYRTVYFITVLSYKSHITFICDPPSAAMSYRLLSELLCKKFCHRIYFPCHYIFRIFHQEISLLINPAEIGFRRCMPRMKMHADLAVALRLPLTCFTYKYRIICHFIISEIYRLQAVLLAEFLKSHNKSRIIRFNFLLIIPLVITFCIN